MKRKPFPLRVNPEILSALQKWADDDLRSVNAQIEYLLRDSLRKAGRLKSDSPDALLNSKESDSGE